jgi:D-3-phosphoglycerate dehydrogenase
MDIMKKVLIADNVPGECLAILKAAGLAVESRPGLTEEGLREALRGVSGLICRSGVKVTARALEQADALEAICRAGVGVDNVDVEAASRRGVAVMNTPGGNTVSTAEHAFALMLGLARNVGPAYIAMREGRWEKKRFVGSQLSGATLGVIGLGRIGQEVAKRAAAFGMKVHAYDPQVSRERAERLGVVLAEDLQTLLAASDYVTVHVPETEGTQGLIGEQTIPLMKDGACVVNCARGAVVDQEAVVRAVVGGKLGGAAFDVFAKEPPEDYAFARHDRILATPHLGASTREAQAAVATEAAQQLVDALVRGQYRNAVNLSLLPPEEMKRLEPWCDLAARLGSLVAQLAGGRPEAVEVVCKGELAQGDTEPVSRYGIMGFMRSRLGPKVNVVSAPYLAAERGIRLTSVRTSGSEGGFTSLVEVRLTANGTVSAAVGTLLGRTHPRIVRINEFDVEVAPEGDLLIVFNNDMPGCIGAVGAALGGARINVARMSVARQQAGGNALLAFNLDSACDEATLARIRAFELVQRAVLVRLCCRPA